MKPETWFLFYEDIEDREVYAGRTTEVDVARDFYETQKAARPYGRSSVLIITPSETSWANASTQWDKL